VYNKESRQVAAVAQRYVAKIFAEGSYPGTIAEVYGVKSTYHPNRWAVVFTLDDVDGEPTTVKHYVNGTWAKSGNLYAMAQTLFGREVETWPECPPDRLVGGRGLVHVVVHEKDDHTEEMKVDKITALRDAKGARVAAPGRSSAEIFGDEGPEVAG